MSDELNDDEQLREDSSNLDMNAVEKQLKKMSPEIFDEVKKRVDAAAQKRKDDSISLGSMTNSELRDFTRRKFGFHPGF